MNKRIRKIAITMAFAIALSSMPQFAPMGTGVVKVEAAKKKESKVKYTLKKGVLTVYGKGSMPKSMTFKNNKKIKQVIIKKGVTSISKNAFYGCKNLETVKIASTVESIGIKAFMNTKIEEVIIPNKVSEIGEKSFYTETLKRITMPGDFSVIWENEYECTEPYGFIGEVDEIVLNTNLNLRCLGWMPTSNIRVMDADTNYTSVDGIIYSKDKKVLMAISPLTKIAVPMEVCEVIDFGFFDFGIRYSGDSLGIYSVEKIVIPSTIKKIQCSTMYASYNATRAANLAEVQLDSENLDVESILNLYELSDKTNLSEEYIINLLDDKGYLTDGMLFWICDNILCKYIGNAKTVVIPDGVTMIERAAFSDNSYVEEVIMSDTVQEIDDSAFFSCEKLRKVYFSKNIEKIGERAFSYTALESIDLPDSVTVIEGQAFEKTNIKEIVLPKNLIEVENAFAYTQIEKVSFPESMTKLPKGIFARCENLKEIVIPESIVEIGAKAFNHCTSLKKIVIKGKIEEISKYMCRGCYDLESIEFPDSVKVVEKNAFNNCTSLKNIGNIDNVTAIKKSAFNGCSSYAVEIQKGVKEIGELAYANCKKGKIVIPSSVKKIGKNAFGNNTNTLVYKGSIKKTKVMYISVNRTYKKNKKAAKLKWDKIKGVKGYQIAIKLYGEKTTYKYIKKNETKMSYGISTRPYVKVRPYKVVKGKKVYGKWSGYFGI